MIKRNDLFRKEALISRAKRPSTTAFQIVQPKTYLIVLSAMLLLILLVVIMMFSKVESTSSAPGVILFRNSKIMPVSSSKDGFIRNISIQQGQKISKGDLIANLEDPYQDEKFKYLVNYHNVSLAHYNQHKDLIDKHKSNIQKHLNEKKHSLESAINNKKNQINFLEKMYIGKKSLNKKGLLSDIELNKSKEAMFEAKEDLDKLYIEISNLELNYKTDLFLQEDKLSDYHKLLIRAKHELDLNNIETQKNYNLLSPDDGIIVEQAASEGQYTKAGDKLFTIMTVIDDAFEVIAFVNSKEGKKISRGMKTYSIPDAYSPLEFGYLIGEVIRVSEYPASKESLNNLLGNSNLVDDFLKDGSPYIVIIKLHPSSETKSGYQWTTKFGAPELLKFGSKVNVKISYEKKSPLNYLLSKMRV